MSKEIILPGLIDVHTHCREPGADHKETFKTATKAALVGGFTTILDMPNNPIPTISLESLTTKRIRAYHQTYVDVGFHFGANYQSTGYFKSVANQVFAYKLYLNHTTGTLLVDDPNHLEAIFAKVPSHKLVMVHAEGEMLEKAIDLAKRHQKKLHAAHISLREEVEMVRKAKEEGVQITAEAAPHHLFLTEKDEAVLGAFGKMRPPLATFRDQKALWKGIESGVIDIIASDHAPHTREEKESDNPPSGIPGLETTLPLMLTEVSRGRINLDKLKELLYSNPRRIFGIPYKRYERPRVIVDLNEKYTIDNKNLQTLCGWSPFDGAVVKGRVKKVILRGNVVFDNGIIYYPPKGKFIEPV